MSSITWRPGMMPFCLSSVSSAGASDSRERRGQVGGVDLDDLVVDDGVADGEVGADEVVEVERPDVVVLLVESAVELLEAASVAACTT